MDQRGKRLLLIATIVILLFLGVTAYFLFFAKKTAPTQSVDVGRNLFPFDQQSPEYQQLPVVNNSGDTVGTGDIGSSAPDPVDSRDQLRKVTSFPISGFVSFVQTVMQPETVINEKTKKEETILRPIPIHHIRYNDQRTGHIFDGIVSDTSILNKQLTKTNLPAAEELIFDPMGRTGYLRYEKRGGVETFKINIPEPPTVPEYCRYADFAEDLKTGSKGTAVKNLQLYINTRFKQKLALDGSYGKGTAGWVQQIQKTLGVSQTKSLDAVTRTAMIDECTKIKETVAKAQNEPLELTGSIINGYIAQMSAYASDWIMLQSAGGKTVGYTGTYAGTTQTRVFESSFNEWMPQYANKNFIGMTTYASGSVDGYLYKLDPVTKQFSKILGPRKALTTLVNPDGTAVLIGSVENNQLVTKIVNLKTQNEQRLSFTTLPEKCVWYSATKLYCGVPVSFPKGFYPDDWYKGIVHFADSIMSYETDTGRTIQVATPAESLDIIRLQADQAMKYLFFMNKTSYELWSYRIEE